MNEKNKEDLQKSYMELQVLNQNIQQTQQNLTMVEEQKTQFQQISRNINETKDIKKNTQIHFQVGPGIFLKGNLADNNEFLVNIGSDIVIKKDREGAKQIVDKQIQELINLSEHLTNELNSNVKKIKNIQEKFESFKESL